MTQEDKELLLKDLCTRLPYGVTIQAKASGGCITKGILWSIDYSETGTFIFHKGSSLGYDTNEDIIKPYLRPMSSMTLEELEEYRRFGDHVRDTECKIHIANYKQIDWLNSNHFDYHGLIPKGHALVAPEGMYGKEEQQ